MKACRVCGRLYADESAFCQADGLELINVSQAPDPSDEADPRVGQTVVGRYTVFRVVADGGMGRVYEALDRQLNRHVALKILHPEVAQDSVSVERFKREYDVSKQLPHDHIVEVVDFQPTQDDSYVLAMEFLVGEELRATLKREKYISPQRAIRMLSQVALGLDLAHQRKLIHRDLKPDNIFLCQTGAGDIAKILDFGSVKDKNETAKQLTVMGTTIGSPFYMSPEQAQGLDTLDQRADVWGLAAIFYECVTGNVPFKGANGPSILLQILSHEPTPPSEAAQGSPFPVPVTLDRVIARALKKAASVRTPSAGQLADDVGHAYGLGGDHREWAQIDESQLGAIIEQNLPQVLNGVTSQQRDEVDDFFGEDDALGVVGASSEEGGAARVGGPELSAMDAAFASANAQNSSDSQAATSKQPSSHGQDVARSVAAQNSGVAPAYPAAADTNELSIPTSSNAWLLMLVGAVVLAGVVAGLFFVL